MFAYTANVACDKNNFVLGFETTPGNTHDSTVFPTLYKRLSEQYPDIKGVVVDAGYKTPAIAKMIFDDQNAIHAIQASHDKERFL